ncbi:MAG: hypothetical protein WAT71_00480 [Ignavibacteria bacterium]
MNYIEKTFPKEYGKIKNYLDINLQAECTKISRVCYNTHDWKKPTGEIGKSTMKSSFEQSRQFGYEEWIADKSRIIDGYHYSFLQSLNSKNHFDRIYDIDLFTTIENKKYLIGKITKGICISNEESSKIYNIYKKNNWLKEMSNELKDIGADYKEFNRIQKSELFNIKYKIEDIKINEEPKLISEKDLNINTFHYKLLDKKSEFLFDSKESDDGNENYRKTDNIIRKINVTVNYDSAHSKIQNKLYDYLKKKNYTEIRFENNRVDMTAISKTNELCFFEIKTYGSARKSIRLALGQLMEYAFWNEGIKVRKLVVVSDNAACKDTLTYIKLLKNKFNIPVYYMAFEFPDKFSEFI